MYTLILIEKDSPSSICWPNLLRKKRVEELSVENIVNKYQGFEGELIYMYQSTGENESEIKNILAQYIEVGELKTCLLLHVISEPDKMPLFLKKQTFHMGYDVGVCEEEKTIYSSIYNEILFGMIDELIYYKRFLNENFLFSDRSRAEQYVCLHNEMSAQGKDVEDYEEMTIYEIWKHKGISNN